MFEQTKNIKCILGPRDTSDLNCSVLFTLTMRRHFLHLKSASFTSFHLAMARFGWLPFADLCVQHLARKVNAEFTEGR